MESFSWYFSQTSNSKALVLRSFTWSSNDNFLLFQESDATDKNYDYFIENRVLEGSNLGPWLLNTTVTLLWLFFSLHVNTVSLKVTLMTELSVFAQLTLHLSSPNYRFSEQTFFNWSDNICSSGKTSLIT